MDCQRNTANNIRYEKDTIGNKINKAWGNIRTTYCLGYKDYFHNFEPEKVKMTNKVLREKSSCVFC